MGRSRPRALEATLEIAHAVVVPIYEYRCECGQLLECIEKVGSSRATCGEECKQSPPVGTGRVVVTALLALIALGLPRGYAAYLEYAPPERGKVMLSLAAAAAPWQTEAADGNWTPRFAGADATLQQSYAAGGERAQLYIAYYRHQTQNKKLVTSENIITGERDWEIINRASITLTVGGERVPFAISEYVWHGRKRVILTTYWVNGQFESRPTFEKLRKAQAQLSGGAREAALVALAMDYQDEAAPALQRLADLATHLPPLKPALEAARAR